MKTLAKQILFGLLALALAVSLIACGGDADTAATTTAGGDDVVTTTAPDDSTDATEDNGGDAQPSGNTTSTSASKQQAQSGKTLTWAQVKANMPANLKNSTVTIFNWNEANSITDAEKAISNFTKDTGIKVDWKIGSYQTYVTEIAAKQAAKDAPDIIRMKDVNPAMMAMLQPLSVTGYDFSDGAWDADLMKMYSYKDVAYATNMKETMMQQPNVLMYNTSLISKYDLEDPFALWKQGKWTLKKLEEICTTFVDEAGDAYKAFSYNMATDFADMLGVSFVTYTNNGYKSTLSDKRLVTGIQTMIKWKENGLLTDSAYARQPFEAGNVLFHHDAIIGARKTHFYNKDLKANGTLGVVPVPTVDGQNTYYQLYRELEAYAVPVGAKNATAVPYFLRYWLDSANYNKNQFFANKNILDVYNYCMSQKNRVFTYNYYTVLTADTGANLLSTTVFNSSQAQVATVLSQNRNVVEAAVRQANSKLDKIQK